MSPFKYVMLLVLNEAGLVFDGRLVINKDCQTNDPHIYGAGPMTKYKRILYADKYRHEHCDSVEVGRRLAQHIRADLDYRKPYGLKVETNLLAKTVQVYTDPKIHFRCLLDNYNYLCICAPGTQVPYEIAKSSENYGMDILTLNDNCHDDFNRAEIEYFRIHLNQHNIIETIYCLTRKKIDVQKYTTLWGKHESLLGNLRNRYEMNMIDDLFEYLNQNWLYALYHDGFPILEKLNNKCMHLFKDAELVLTDEIIDKLIRNQWKRLPDNHRMSIVELYSTSLYEKQIIENLIRYISDNIEELSMYYDCGKRSQ